jgi:hypothetical protein
MRIERRRSRRASLPTVVFVDPRLRPDDRGEGVSGFHSSAVTFVTSDRPGLNDRQNDTQPLNKVISPVL